MRSSRLVLQDYQSKFEDDVRNEAKKEMAVRRKLSKKQKNKKADTHADLEFFDEIGPLCLALYKSKLVAMKRVYKTNTTLNRTVLKELKQVMRQDSHLH